MMVAEPRARTHGANLEITHTAPSAEELERVCEGLDPLETHYQPIVDLRHGVACGYEALSRFPRRPCTPPGAWFRAAAEHGFATRLESIAVRSAVASRRSVPPNCFLAVNVSPEALVSGDLAGDLDGMETLDAMVIEVTEQTPVRDHVGLLASLEALGEAGATLAVDDVGDRFGTLRHVVSVRPQFVKVDRSLVAGIHADESSVAAVEAVMAFAAKMNCWVIAEGVERVEELDTLIRLGVPLAQGYLFGRARPTMEPLDPHLGERIRAQAVTRDRGRGIRALLDRPPVVYESDARTALRQRFDAARRLEWIPVLDERNHPVAIARRPSARRGEPPLAAVMTVHPDEAASSVARRAMTRERDERLVPLACCDTSGRYVALLRVERLVEELAAIPQRYARGSRVSGSPRILHPPGT